MSAKPHEKQTRTSLEIGARRMGRRIAKSLPPGVGFALFLFDLGDGGHLAYLSNANRADMAKALREFLGKLEDGVVSSVLQDS